MAFNSWNRWACLIAKTQDPELLYYTLLPFSKANSSRLTSHQFADAGPLGFEFVFACDSSKNSRVTRIRNALKELTDRWNSRVTCGGSCVKSRARQNMKGDQDAWP